MRCPDLAVIRFKKSFKKCIISNSLDGMEDYILWQGDDDTIERENDGDDASEDDIGDDSSEYVFEDGDGSPIWYCSVTQRSLSTVFDMFYQLKYSGWFIHRGYLKTMFYKLKYRGRLIHKGYHKTMFYQLKYIRGRFIHRGYLKTIFYQFKYKGWLINRPICTKLLYIVYASQFCCHGDVVVRKCSQKVWSRDYSQKLPSRLFSVALKFCHQNVLLV